MQLAFLGGGNMGRALIGGLLRRGTRPEQISVGESVEAARASLAHDLGIMATADNVVAVENAELIVLAVKPQDAAAVLASLQPLLKRNQPIVLSVAAGIRVAALESWCGPGNSRGARHAQQAGARGCGCDGALRARPCRRRRPRSRRTHHAFGR